MSLLKSNSVQIGQSATATNNFTLSVPSSPDGTIKLARGNSGATTQDILTVNSSGAVALANGGAITSGTAQASTSGTAIDFTGIPSWAKRITVMFQGVSVNGATTVQVQLGTGGSPTTSGYVSGNSYVTTINDTTRGIVSATTGFRAFVADDPADAITGSFVFTNINGNAWICNGSLAVIGTNNGISNVLGSIALAGVLNMVRITTLNGTSTFDAGSVNIMYEG